jgi:hypothetical protein
VRKRLHAEWLHLTSSIPALSWKCLLYADLVSHNDVLKSVLTNPESEEILAITLHFLDIAARPFLERIFPQS